MEEGRNKKGQFSKGNRFSLGLTTSGRPPIFKTPEEMETKALEYFESLIYIDDEGNEQSKPSLITGVALFLGYTSLNGFYEQQVKPEFSNIVTRIRLTVESSYEEGLHSKFATGCQFALNNMGWKNQSEIKLNQSLDTVAERKDVLAAIRAKHKKDK